MSRRRRFVAVGVASLAAFGFVAVLAALVFQYGWPWQMSSVDRNHVYSSPVGSIRYQVHVPPQYQHAAPGAAPRLPVIMALHGCGMTGYGYNSMKATTQFNELADREGFIVVYPTQRILRSPINCWNSGDPREQDRNAGEPALLAGVASQVIETYRADASGVHVTGASSGAGTAVILAATYPDVFASASSIAGGEYGLNQVDPKDPDATPPSYTARQAWSQMGERARPVPLLVVQGERDEVVVPLVGRRLVEHWSAVADLVDDGLLNDSLALVRRRTNEPAVDGRHSYTHTMLRSHNDQVVVESYVVDGLAHAWPGPAGEGFFTDRAGPDASLIVWEFAAQHFKPAGGK